VTKIILGGFKKNLFFKEKNTWWFLESPLTPRMLRHALCINYNINYSIDLNNFELDIFFKEEIQKVTVDYIRKISKRLL